MTGWQNNPPFSIDEAQQIGADVYEVLVQGWGSFDKQDHSVKNFQWPVSGPALPVSLAAIAIGPRSTVDRCWVSYNLNKTKTIVDSESGTHITDRLRRLSLDSPLVFSQPAKRGAMYAPPADLPLAMTQQGMLQIFAYANTPTKSYNWYEDTDQFPPATRYQDTTIIPAIFTGSIGDDVDLSSGDYDRLWGQPLLHLYLYLKAPPTYVPPKRFPLQAYGKYPDDLEPLPADVPTLVAMIPTFGRRAVQIMMTGGGAATTFDYHIDALRAINPGVGTNQAAPFDSIAAVANGVPAVLGSCNTSNAYADYLNLYVTPHGGTGSIEWSVTAYD